MLDRKISATRCQILRLKCIQLDFRWGSASDPAGGAYSAPPDSLAVFRGPTSKEREEGEWKGEEKKGREGKGRRRRTLPQIPGYATCIGHIVGHFGDESFQAIACTGTDNTKQTGENTPQTQIYKINKLALCK